MPSTGASSSSENNKPPCVFFALCECKNASTCAFAHDLSKAEFKFDFPREFPAKNWTREIAGAVVTFGDGATVRGLYVPTEFSTVRISNLVPSITKETLFAFLPRVEGLVIRKDDILSLRKDSATGAQTARIRVESLKLAWALCDALKVDKLGLFPSIEATTWTRKLPPGTPHIRVRTVVWSWDRPARRVLLRFCTTSIADKIYAISKRGALKILGHRVNALKPGSTQGFLSDFTVMLTDVPWEADEDDITSQFPNKYLAEMELEPDRISDFFRTMLSRFGPFVDWEVRPESKGNLKRLEVRARFTYEADARNAAALLSKPHAEVKLNVELRTSVKFRITNPVYGLIEEQIIAFKASWERAGINVNVYQSGLASNVVNIESADSNAVAYAKIALQEILRGRVASHQGKELWHPGFAFHTGEIRRWVKLVEGQCQVQIKEDSSKSQLRILGSEKGYDQAVEVLASLLSQIEQTQPVPGPGDKAGHSEEEQEHECAVCFCPPEDPIESSCGHRYCKDCFTTMARAAGSFTATRQFSISCVALGVGQPCKKLFSLDELMAHLPRPDFEGVLRASFNSSIRRRPEKYGHCPTPDCENIFRSTSGEKTPPRTQTFTCPNCLEPNCSNCHSPHIGMSCGDYKKNMAGGADALRRAKQELGIKDCPRCSAPIEKFAGCNHVACEQGCGAHICWTCLEHFPTSKKCYDHMWAVHGRIYDEGAEPVPQELQAAVPGLEPNDEDVALFLEEQ
ncbi:hypothetical protein V8F33_012125 [Rhypophila sp. PSN 637]